MGNIRDEIELIVLRAMSSATSTFRYHVGHDFGGEIDNEVRGKEATVKQALSKMNIDARLKMESAIVDTIEKQVRKIIKKAKTP